MQLTKQDGEAIFERLLEENFWPQVRRVNREELPDAMVAYDYFFNVIFDGEISHDQFDTIVEIANDWDLDVSIVTEHVINYSSSIESIHLVVVLG